MCEKGKQSVERWRERVNDRVIEGNSGRERGERESKRKKEEERWKERGKMRENECGERESGRVREKGK